MSAAGAPRKRVDGEFLNNSAAAGLRQAWIRGSRDQRRPAREEPPRLAEVSTVRIRKVSRNGYRTARSLFHHGSIPVQQDPRQSPASTATCASPSRILFSLSALPLVRTKDEHYSILLLSISRSYRALHTICGCNLTSDKPLPLLVSEDLRSQGPVLARFGIRQGSAGDSLQSRRRDGSRHPTECGAKSGVRLRGVGVGMEKPQSIQLEI
ncbi:hypothetical protein BV25DRAFT_1509423 [Artomyces pyxidatus]|uniref:Uncharacterized protein n=1 Tax=Artomyces pyxidatus TaxID=48021 RepID=A0ACB8TB69_9AGAM|nr:hypothetical protein BV25DRAFT_1509423 [Artomyces pyxidatus]